MSEMRPCSAMDRQTGSKVGNQAKPLKYCKKKFSCISTNLEQVFKRMASDLNTQPMTQQRPMCALKVARLLPDGCCYLSNTGNKILFRINWGCVHQGFSVTPQEEVHWCEVW